MLVNKKKIVIKTFINFYWRTDFLNYLTEKEGRCDTKNKSIPFYVYALPHRDKSGQSVILRIFAPLGTQKYLNSDRTGIRKSQNETWHVHC